MCCGSAGECPGGGHLPSGIDQVAAAVRSLRQQRLLIVAVPDASTYPEAMEHLQKELQDRALLLVSFGPVSPGWKSASLIVERSALSPRVSKGLRTLFRLWRAVRGHEARAALLLIRHYSVNPHRWAATAMCHLGGARRVVIYDPTAESMQVRTAWHTWLQVPSVVARRVGLRLGVIWDSLALPRPGRLTWQGNLPEGPLRILFLRTDVELALGSAQIGGSASHVKGIIGGFRRLGHRVDAVTSGPLTGALPDSLRVIEPTLVADVPWEGSELAAAADFSRRLPSLLRGEKFDLVYQRYGIYNLAGLRFARSRGIPLILEANNSEVVMRSRFTRLAFPSLAKRTERYLFASADRIVTVSNQARTDVIQHGGHPDLVLTVPNGVDSDVFAPRPLEEVRRFRAERGFGDCLLVGFAGRFYPWHGLEYLVEAFGKVLSGHPAARLILLGDGDCRGRVEGQAHELGIQERVLFPGLVPHEDVPLWLSAMDILVAPHAPWQEFFGSPVKLFEYMSVGGAIVASNVGQMGELIEHRRNGWLVAPGDPAAIAGAILELAADRNMRERMGEAARIDAIELHSWVARAQAILSQQVQS